MYPLLVTAAIIEHDRNILLTRRRLNVPYPLLWEFPGGKVEPMENPLDCVVREIREELAIEIAVEGIYDVVYYRYPERTVLVLAYRCSWLSGEIADLEVAEHCWVKPAEILSFQLLPADIPLAERICREFA
ncbi:MAG: NUDIX hydrolase MutT [Geobacteraceae bacterium]|nr:MAG: NUDIX hydrolase MutT [Geobacteraceae bacterium]